MTLLRTANCLPEESTRCVQYAYLAIRPKNAFLHPNDPSALFPQHQPEPILDARVSSHPEAVLEYVERRLQNKHRKPDLNEYARTTEEENEFEMLQAMKGMQVDDERAEEEDMNELVNAMGRLQIHQKVKASRCKIDITLDKKGKKGTGMVEENTSNPGWKDNGPKYDKKKTKAAKHKRF